MPQMKSGKLLQIICDRQSIDKRAQGKQAMKQAFGKLKGHYSSALFMFHVKHFIRLQRKYFHQGIYQLYNLKES